MRVLMIGNSYTAMTQRVLKGFLEADPKIDVELVAYCPGGKTLAEHAQNPKVDALLTKRGRWDVVVLQDQSQLPAYAMGGPRDENLLKQLDAGAPVLIPRIRKAQPKAKIILFETWARHRAPDKAGTLKYFDGDPKKMQSALNAAYRRMVEKTGHWDFSKFVAIAPVGPAFEAWYEKFGYQDARRKLHCPDSSHPGPLGALLAGAVLYETITGRPASKVNYAGPLARQPGGARLAKDLKRFADQVCRAKRDS
jgi:hypothetical protein